jgi:hypothetical protein
MKSVIEFLDRFFEEEIEEKEKENAAPETKKAQSVEEIISESEALAKVIVAETVEKA